ncbi:MAG: pyridoxal phosphate-dependent aminotransferase [Candidatus Thorarchaeota archaeon]|nr:pyridoxal phosphate-dependent aminotransferase [Candidatus Thorarchaeota archaeon]
MRFRTHKIMPPPIVELMELARDYIASPDFLNLGQGTSGYIPPKEALKVLGEQVWNPSLHGYSPDQGILELREELALYMRRVHGIDADPHDELVITAGANQAFAGIVMTLVEPGDNVIVPDPYYFNSIMAIQMAGGQERPVAVGSGFQIDVDGIRQAIDTRTKAIVLITPNNPTGAVYEEDLINEVVDLCIEHDIMLISDETYARLIFDGATHYSPRSRRDAEEHVITLGSFSKDLGMAGWRVGFIVGSPNYIKEYMKIQDTVTICAPTAGQMLALEVLRNGTEYVDFELERLALLRDLAYARIDDIDQLEVTRTAGTFYLFPRVRDCANSRELAIDLLRKTSTFLLPGSVFGAAGEGHIRISIGPLTPEAVDEAFDRLEIYFAEN